jgi:ABC-type multidrug transport system fused ATPase/permease subunit
MISSILGNLKYFYKYLGSRIFFVLILSLLVGVMDGFGLAMFIPILELVSDSQEVFDPEKMGNLAFIIQLFNWLSLSMTLYTVLLIMLSFFILKGVLMFIEQYLSIIYRQSFIKKIRVENILGIANADYQYYTQLDSGRAQNTMSGEVGQVVAAYAVFMKFLNQGVLLMIYLVLAFLSNANFALIVVVGAFLVNLLVRRLFTMTKELSGSRTIHGHSFQLLLVQYIDKYKYLKATGLVQKYGQKLVAVVEALEQNNTKSSIIGSLLASFREPILLTVVVAAILIQITFFSSNMGAILLSLLLFYRALTAALIIQTNWNEYLSYSGTISNMQQFQETLHAAKEIDGDIVFGKFNKQIELENIEVQIGHKQILKNISLAIPNNKIVAFVGESGAGKTTLMNLLTGLIKPQSGKLLIDGVPLEHYTIATYQQRTGYITQEPVIFNDTIFNNVSFWAEPTQANYTKCYQALTLAHLDQLIEQLPLKIDTLLGINGINLSGGQKQRVAIARELYKDIDILFMDEATSALDTETETSIQENIASLKGKYTIIIIAHRLSTIRMADIVYVLSEGEIIKKGSYAEVIKETGEQ